MNGAQTGTSDFQAEEINVNGQNTATLTLRPDATLGGQVDNWDITATHGAVTFAGAQNVALTGVTGTTPTTLLSAIFGKEDHTDGTGTVTLSANSPITIQTDSNRFVGGANVDIEPIPAAIVTYTNSLSIPRTTGGYYAVRTTLGTTETQTVGVTRFEANANPLVLNNSSWESTSAVGFASGSHIDLYIKYDSDLTTLGQAGVDRVVYQEGVQTFTLVDQTTTHNAVVPATVATALVNNAAAVPTNVTLETSTVNASGEFAQTVTNNVNDTALTITQLPGLGIAITLGNREQYFQTWYQNRASSTLPIIEFAQNDTVNWDNTRVLFASGNTSSGNRVQHVIQNWASVGSEAFAQSRSGAAEILPLISGAAAISTVIAAVDASAVASTVTENNTRIRQLQTNEKTKPGPLKGTTTFKPCTVKEIRG